MTISDKSLRLMIKDHDDLQGQKFVIKGSAFASEYIQKAIVFLPTVAQQLIDARAHEDALAAEVARLRGALEKMVAEAEWISVEERLPEPDKSVLVLFNYDDGVNLPRIGFGIKFLDEITVHTVDGDFDKTVTHWRPLPSPSSPALEAAKEALK